MLPYSTSMPTTHAHDDRTGSHWYNRNIQKLASHSMRYMFRYKLAAESEFLKVWCSKNADAARKGIWKFYEGFITLRHGGFRGSEVRMPGFGTNLEVTTPIVNTTENKDL